MKSVYLATTWKKYETMAQNYSRLYIKSLLLEIIIVPLYPKPIILYYVLVILILLLLNKRYTNLI